MKVLIIPDVHLKPWMFERATEIMKKSVADKVVCLMDIADDWGKEFEFELYENSYNAAIEFAKEYPDSLWCYGNHDLSYVWDMPETGYSPMMGSIVKRRLAILEETLLDKGQLAYLHRIDDVVFCHGGLTDYFVRLYTKASQYNNIDDVIKTINSLGEREIWEDASPVWYRPQHYNGKMYKPRKLLQVVGHTPVEKTLKQKNVISTDTFSTYFDEPIGVQMFSIIDTKTWETECIK